jgi:GTP-binding protein
VKRIGVPHFPYNDFIQRMLPARTGTPRPHREGEVTVPIVAIVGRPNVGKSSLFNALARRRIAIVAPTAGVTRDRVSALVQADHRDFELVDTGGMGIQDHDDLTAEVEQQIETAMDQAQVVLFVVDARAGIAPLDLRVAERLRHVAKPMICVANKCDTSAVDPHAAEFHQFGFAPLLCVSAQHKRGIQELLDLILERLPEPEKAEPNRDVAMKLAIVGRRNTGKSTFINSLAQTERMIVSEVPGTTRDSVDVRFERDGKVFIAIDTAGVRRKGSIASDIEFYSLTRAQRSIRRADVVLLFLDATQPISKVDKQLADYILEQYKPAIFAVNKWDLLIPMATGEFATYLRRVFPSLDFVPIAFTTAKEGKNVYAVLNLAQNLFKQASRRVHTGDLNRVLRRALEQQPPPLRQNRRPKIFYATQVATNPPTIVLFTNGPELFDPTYQRYLLKAFRDHLAFPDVPIKLYLRQAHRGAERLESEREKSEQKPRPRKGDRRAPELWKDL